MKITRKILVRGGEVGELLTFLWRAKLWFLIPFVLVLLIFGILFVFVYTTGVTPFIYALF